MDKRKAFPALSFILFFCFPSFSQTGFQKFYPASNVSIGYSMVADSSGYAIVGSTTASGEGAQDILFIKTDPEGNIIRARTFGGPGNESARAIKKTSDSGYILAGVTSSYVSSSADSSNYFIVKTDSSGNILWTRSIGPPGVDVACDVIESHDHKYIVTGYTKSFGAGNEDVYLMALDSAGNLLWDYAMGGSGSDFGNSLIQTPNHHFLIVGSTTGFGATGQIPLLIEAIETGQMLYTNTFDLSTPFPTNKRYFTKIIEGYANDYIITGSDGIETFGQAQHILLSFNQNYTVNWMYDYFLNSGECVGTSVSKTATGGFVIGGTMGFDHPALITTNSTGQLISTKFYPEVNASYFGKGLDVISEPGAHVLLGFKHDSTDTTLYLLKTDNMLSSGCHEQDGFFNTQGTITPLITFQSSAFFSFPSNTMVWADSGVAMPAPRYMDVICSVLGFDETRTIENITFQKGMDYLDIVLNEPDEEVEDVTIYSALGNEVIKQSQQHVKLNDLPAGYYFVRVTTKKKSEFFGRFFR
jgi:hypothetical protein